MTRPPTAIASPSNPRIRAAAALRDRRGRDRTGRILIEGTRELGQAIDAGIVLESVLVCDSLVSTAGARALVDRLVAVDASVVRVSEAAFAKVAFGDRAEGLIGIGLRPLAELGSLRLPRVPLVAVVDSIEKPGNLGAIVRTADGAGADALVAAGTGTDPFNPAVIRASMGMVFSLPVAAATTEETIAWLRDQHLRIVAARSDAPTPYTEIDLRGPLAIVVGSEATGLPDAWSGDDITPVRIPMLGAADSLNASVAAAVILYEALRQRAAADVT